MIRVRSRGGSFADVPADALDGTECEIAVVDDDAADGVYLRGVVMHHSDRGSVVSCGGLFARVTERLPLETKVLVRVSSATSA